MVCTRPKVVTPNKLHEVSAKYGIFGRYGCRIPPFWLRAVCRPKGRARNLPRVPTMTLPVFARPSLRLMLAAIVLALVLTIGNAPFTHAQTFTVFHSFTGGDGSIPNGDLIQDRAGNFYGTTE